MSYFVPDIAGDAVLVGSLAQEGWDGVLVVSETWSGAVGSAVADVAESRLGAVLESLSITILRKCAYLVTVVLTSNNATTEGTARVDLGFTPGNLRAVSQCRLR